MQESLNEMFARLRAPFPVDLVQWRVGARTKDKARGQALPYLNARLVQDRLDEVMGPANWRNELMAAPGGNGLMCVISLRINGEWINKTDVAQQDEVPENAQDQEKAREIAVKGAASDAFKRAAVLWGIGRYLYAFEAPWVDLEKERYIAKDELPKLKSLLKHFSLENQSQQGKADTSSAATGPRESVRAAAADQGGMQAMTDAPAKAHGEQRTGGSEETPKRGKPAFGTDEQWASLSERQRSVVKSIFDRVRHNAPLASIETYLTEGQGKNFPEWLKEGLLTRIRKRIKEQAEQAREGTVKAA